MSATNAFPPSVILPNSLKPIAISDAQQILAAYLKRSETQPHLHPDAVLQPSGPTFSVQGGPEGGLVLQQLRRVEAGLRGEILKLDPKSSTAKQSDDTRLDALIAETEEQENTFEETPRKKGGLKRKSAVFDAGSSQDLVDGANDAQELAAAQLDSDAEADMIHGAEVGELGDRSNVVEYAGDVPKVKTPKKPSKEERKAAKKERKKLDKAQRAASKHEQKAEDVPMVNGEDEKDGESKEARKEKMEKKREKKKKKVDHKAGD